MTGLHGGPGPLPGSPGSGPLDGGTPRRLVVVSAGLRQPSSTRLLADRMTTAAVDALELAGVAVSATTVELREHARDMTSMILTGVPSPALTALLDQVRSADALVLVTPIWSGSYTGMVKDLVDLVGEDGLAGIPVLMGATAGTGRHALALEHTLRPLLGHVKALVVPTGVFAATEDFGEVAGSPTADAVSIDSRIGRAVGELAARGAARPPRPVHDPWQVTDFSELLG
jgi:FMN reductase